MLSLYVGKGIVVLHYGPCAPRIKDLTHWWYIEGAATFLCIHRLPRSTLNDVSTLITNNSSNSSLTEARSDSSFLEQSLFTLIGFLDDHDALLEMVNQPNWKDCSHRDHIGRLSIVNHHTRDRLVDEGPQDINRSIATLNITILLISVKKHSF